MRSVDTNVLVRLLTRDDPRQVAAAEKFVVSGAWVSHLVLLEATWVLGSVYELRPSQIADAVEMLLEHEHLAMQRRDVVAAALERFRDNLALGFSDCLVVEVARSAGHIPLGTFDRILGATDGAQKI